MADDPLVALRPIRWPETVPILDAGSLIEAAVAGAIAALVVVGILALARRRGGPSPRAEAIAAIRAARGLPPAERLAAEAAALRRYVARVEGTDAASVQGEAWLAGLDRHFRTTAFTAGDGRIVAEALYRPEALPQDDRFGRLLERLLQRRRG